MPGAAITRASFPACCRRAANLRMLCIGAPSTLNPLAELANIDGRNLTR